MPLTDAAKSPRRLGNCVKLKVKSMHPSNTSGGLRLLGRLKLVTRRCSRGTTKISRQTRDCEKSTKTKTSSYTQKFRKRYGPDVKSFPDIAKATGFL
jgi:hypothetical protein